MTDHSNALYMWTLYDSPGDYGPGTYVARKWLVDRNGPTPTVDVILTASLDALREHMLDRGLARIDRHPTDDAAIIETWV